MYIRSDQIVCQSWHTILKGVAFKRLIPNGKSSRRMVIISVALSFCLVWEYEADGRGISQMAFGINPDHENGVLQSH